MFFYYNAYSFVTQLFYYNAPIFRFYVMTLFRIVVVLRRWRPRFSLHPTGFRNIQNECLLLANTLFNKKVWNNWVFVGVDFAPENCICSEF